MPKQRNDSFDNPQWVKMYDNAIGTKLTLYDLFGVDITLEVVKDFPEWETFYVDGYTNGDNIFSEDIKVGTIEEAQVETLKLLRSKFMEWHEQTSHLINNAFN